MMKTIVSLLLVNFGTFGGPPLDCERPQDDDAGFCHLFVASGSQQKNTATEHLSSISMFDNESRRRHEIDLPESFLKEHHLIMQNPVLSYPGGAITKDSVHVPKTPDIG
jgi:hypothetical protein